MKSSKRIPAVFYQSAKGGEPVRDWLKKLSNSDRRSIGGDLKDIEFGWPIGMPLCRSLGDGLWEVRSNLADGKIARVIFCIWRGRLVLLHGFIKKTRKTPSLDRKLALRRKRDVEING